MLFVTRGWVRGAPRNRFRRRSRGLEGPVLGRNGTQRTSAHRTDHAIRRPPVRANFNVAACHGRCDWLRTLNRCDSLRPSTKLSAPSQSIPR